MAEEIPGGKQPNPGDGAAPAAAWTPDDVCPKCQGTGKIQGAECDGCGGTGVVTEAIGGG
jgi:DnaJ-class molecular chaperone